MHMSRESEVLRDCHLSSIQYCQLGQTIFGRQVMLPYRSRIGNIVCHDTSHLWEVPSVPFSHSHGIGVQFLVKVIQKADCLHYHCVYLQRATHNNGKGAVRMRGERCAASHIQAQVVWESKFHKSKCLCMAPIAYQTLSLKSKHICSRTIFHPAEWMRSVKSVFTCLRICCTGRKACKVTSA